jgi:hypothetical protein
MVVTGPVESQRLTERRAIDYGSGSWASAARSAGSSHTAGSSAATPGTLTERASRRPVMSDERGRALTDLAERVAHLRRTPA